MGPVLTTTEKRDTINTNIRSIPTVPTESEPLSNASRTDNIEGDNYEKESVVKAPIITKDLIGIASPDNIVLTERVYDSALEETTVKDGLDISTDDIMIIDDSIEDIKVIPRLNINLKEIKKLETSTDTSYNEDVMIIDDPDPILEALTKESTSIDNVSPLTPILKSSTENKTTDDSDDIMIIDDIPAEPEIINLADDDDDEEENINTTKIADYKVTEIKVDTDEIMNIDEILGPIPTNPGSPNTANLELDVLSNDQMIFDNDEPMKQINTVKEIVQERISETYQTEVEKSDAKIQSIGKDKESVQIGLEKDVNMPEIDVTCRESVDISDDEEFILKESEKNVIEDHKIREKTMTEDISVEKENNNLLENDKSSEIIKQKNKNIEIETEKSDLIESKKDGELDNLPTKNTESESAIQNLLSLYKNKECNQDKECNKDKECKLNTTEETILLESSTNFLDQEIIKPIKELSMTIEVKETEKDELNDKSESEKDKEKTLYDFPENLTSEWIKLTKEMEKLADEPKKLDDNIEKLTDEIQKLCDESTKLFDDTQHESRKLIDRSMEYMETDGDNKEQKKAIEELKIKSIKYDEKININESEQGKSNITQNINDTISISVDTSDDSDNEKSNKDIKKLDEKMLNQNKEIIRTIQNTVNAINEIITIDDTDDNSKNVSLLRNKLTEVTNEQNVDEQKIIKQLTENVVEKEKQRECVNFVCKNKSSVFHLAPLFVLSYYGIKKKPKKLQFVCSDCFDQTVDQYEELCGALVNHQPLLQQNLPKQADLVEISSSDDDDEDHDESFKDTNFLSLEDIQVLKDNLDDILPETLKRVSINQQMEWNTQLLTESFNQNQKILEELEESVRVLQKGADQMHFTLYNIQESFTIKRLPPVNLDSDCIEHTEPFEFPVEGKLQRPQINSVDDYLAAHKTNVSWTSCKVTEIIESRVNGKIVFNYKVQFLRQKGIVIKMLSGKNLAYGNPSIERYPIGCRVIASFNSDKISEKKFNNSQVNRTHYFPGIVAEPIQPNTNFRYLIFFDDGYTSYISHENIRLVCDSSANVWEDVLEGSREFIHEYLMESDQRAMVQVKKGQRIVTEYKGIWLPAKVTDIDCSLVQLYFEEDKRYEWIYRGSMRLAPLFREKQNSKLATGTQLLKRNEPYIEYITITEDFRPKPPKVIPEVKELNPPIAPKEIPKAIPNRAVAKKSTVVNQIVRPQLPISLNRSTIVVDATTQPGKITYFTVKKPRAPLQYQVHNCNPRCLYQVTDNLTPYSPLAKPLLSGWERQIPTTRTSKKKVIIYKGPCGKRMRNMHELHHYLRVTKSPLNVECFDFDVQVYCLAEWTVDKQFIRNQDLSDGLEEIAISCVNCFGTSLPPPCIYSTKRVPTEGVNLNLDQNFLCGCDCIDDCLDKTKCQCWQLTIAGAKLKNANIPNHQIGYEFKRLLDPVPTGIYECNARCKCNSRCINRVVQHPLNIKLQVFKTRNRGWGLRTINDIPKGGFICIYAGHLLTEQRANEGGATDGDEYFAELDYIEVVERLKEGYESDIPEEGLEDSSSESDKEQQASLDHSMDSDTEFKANLSERARKTMKTRSSTRKLTTGQKSINQLFNEKQSTSSSDKNDVEKDKNKSMVVDDCITISDDEDVRVPVNFMPDSSLLDLNDDEVQSKYKSVRKMYGKNEYSFIMDAKKTGNVGRYFNHSCQPNLFVQNVFVDTHDLRFPWVAFFSSEPIRAGTELTWNYNYDVGSVPGKVLFCECGALSCRGRLL